MQCPTCKSIMAVAEHDRIELDFCTRCQGVWFDSGELELLLERSSGNEKGHALGEALKLPGANVSEKGRRCPICRKTMNKVHVGPKNDVLIDSCPQGHGLWFDGGEVEELIHQLEGKDSVPAAGREKAVSFLGEVFKARHDANSHEGGIK